MPVIVLPLNSVRSRPPRPVGLIASGVAVDAVPDDLGVAGDRRVAGQPQQAAAADQRHRREGVGPLGQLDVHVAFAAHDAVVDLRRILARGQRRGGLDDLRRFEVVDLGPATPSASASEMLIFCVSVPGLNCSAGGSVTFTK